ncbi:Gaa1-domain-containing protein [Stereum hirsutum FP-91666 SS1]|uniref:Gaa1-domain-containing protein n=1 Tax=Stereum hirsutum (strain FP-91666) TaxID=721885 RepID=UPI000440AA14|nr:Gaa1-domain-containing protein [Stereum hirsutum FP-91666 SS1]EIM89833.1 Gaa1-domain-containing protein [Stereum hirsutum FP-91666 SS1]
MPPKLLQRLFSKKKSKAEVNVSRIQRRRVLTGLLWRHLNALRLLLLLVGYAWLLFLPSPRLGSRTYIDENALQPAQVSTYWNWNDVHRADRYLDELELMRDRNASHEERANYFMTEFSKLGLPASTQKYALSTSQEELVGTNAYAMFSSPRASGAEAMLISTSWLSQSGNGDALNLRGVATVLALSAFLKKYSHWSKDIIFVISDGYLDGMQAFLNEYHGSFQSNLQAEPLIYSSGVIWTALNIDYPGHSFSHLGVFREGVNGRLPNQDLINAFSIISRHTGGVPVLVYDHHEPSEFPGRQAIVEMMPTWVPPSVTGRDDVIQYGYRARNILKHVGHQARGRPSGVHGLLHQFRIDAITLFAVPSNGPHGFHALGRVVESTLRTMNNLLERLHASFFFYIMTTPTSFLKIGMYLPSAVIIGVALMFSGLREWVQAGWVQIPVAEDTDPGVSDEKQHRMVGRRLRWVKRARNVLPVMGIMLVTHILGGLVFMTISSSWFIGNQNVATLPLILLMGTLPLATLLYTPTDYTTRSPLSTLLKSLLLCISSTIISITSMLNFSLAALLAISLGIPLTLASPSSPSSSRPSTHSSPLALVSRIVKYTIYATLALSWLLLEDEVRQGVWYWDVAGVWFAPFVCVVYVPLMLQAGIVCLLA